MEVECGNAVRYGNRIARKVAPNGILYAKRGMTLAKGATAYDALKRTGLVLDSKTSAFGVYIRAIQSLAEKACGPQSGWMYTVNGQIASVGCGAYELRDGDTVRWRYSCNMGRDL